MSTTFFKVFDGILGLGFDDLAMNGVPAMMLGIGKVGLGRGLANLRGTHGATQPTDLLRQALMNSRQLKKPVFGRWALDDVFCGWATRYTSDGKEGSYGWDVLDIHIYILYTQLYNIFTYSYGFIVLQMVMSPQVVTYH